MGDHHEKTALIAGAQRGIGAAIARRLAADGASLWINAVEELDRARELALGLGGEVVEADITDSEQVERVGSLDILANNAADQSKQALLEADRGTWDRTRAVNITGAVLMMQASIPRLGARGSIVNVASMHSFVPLAGAAAYATSKAALAMLTRQAAMELGGHGIASTPSRPAQSLPPATNSGAVRAARASTPTCRCGGPEGPRRLPRWSRFSPRTTPLTSLAPCGRSTAGRWSRIPGAERKPRN